MSIYLDILGIIYESKEPLNGREIARKLDISPQTVLNWIDIMLKDKILEKKEKGNSIEYLIPNSFLSLSYINYYEVAKSLNFLKKKEIKIIIEDILKFSKSVILFGSFAKNKEHKDSDMDLIVINGDKKRIKDLITKYPRKINIEYHSYDSFFKAKNTHLFKEIFDNHVIFGNSFEVVKGFRELK